MALFEIILGFAFERFYLFSCLGLGISTAIILLYQLHYHPIAHIPGPFLAKLTPLWLYYHAYIGDEASVIHELHKTYGPYLRVTPNHVDIGDADAIQPIYITGGGFPKSECYANFDIDGHKTIFSTTDPAYRTPRAKAVVPMFSSASIRSNSKEIYACVNSMVSRLQVESASGRPVNVLNLTRSLAVDIVSTHLFEMNYNGTEEKTQRLSVSAFVDAFVAVGRFFYLPNWAFIWMEWVTNILMHDEHTSSSMEIVDKFVDEMVAKTTEGKTNYPGRLMDLGLEDTEIKAQCKDLIFAGTDSTGMNLATICRYLAMNQSWLDVLDREIQQNRSSSSKIEIQSLPCLTATIKETLRLSMANPSRLPHVVPLGGWNFKSTYFPAGIDVGCSSFEMHLNPVAFPDPEAFKPGRWLTEDSASKEAMNKHWFAFGAGTRACIARNLAMTELYMGTEKLVESGVLKGAMACQERIEIFEWFNSSVKGEKIELIWPRQIAK